MSKKMKKKLEGVYFRYHHIRTWVFLLIVMSSCTNQTNISDDFNNYLTTLEKQIPESEHFYIVLSKYACQTCLKGLLPVFIEKTKSHDHNKFTYIIANNNIYPSLNNSKSEIIFDRAELISRLNMNISDFTIVKTEEQEIKAIWNFGAADYDKFSLFLNTELK